MSTCHDFEGVNVRALSPPGLEEMVGSIYVFHNGRSCVSAWKPDAQFLEELNNGGSIYVTMMTGQTEDGRPCIIPHFVGSESDVLDVTSDTGKVWK